MRARYGLVWLAVVCAGICPVAKAAKPLLPAPSTWRLDLMRSDFGGGPRVKSEVFTVESSKGAMMRMEFVTVDAAGETVKSSWSGREDGKLQPMEGSPGTSFGIDKKGDEHWVYADGKTCDGKLSVGKDKQSLLVRLTVRMKDGQEFHQMLIYERTE